MTVKAPLGAEESLYEDPNERNMIQRYLQAIVAKVPVSDQEVADFYQANKDACGGATLDQVKDQIKQMVLQQKQQDWVRWESSSQWKACLPH
jgi:hypothetical protein